jgi:hypothetical protein
MYVAGRWSGILGFPGFQTLPLFSILIMHGPRNIKTNYEFTVLIESYATGTCRYLFHYVFQNLSIFKRLEVPSNDSR